MSSMLKATKGGRVFKPKPVARNRMRAHQAEMERLTQEMTSMRMDIDEEPDDKMTQQTEQALQPAGPTEEAQRAKRIHTFKLVQALPGVGLDIRDRDPDSSRWFLSRQKLDVSVVDALEMDMPSGEKPHKRFVQPILAQTFTKATDMVSQGVLGQGLPRGVDASLGDAKMNTYMWSVFFKKLQWMDHQAWSGELPPWLFRAFFSGLVNSREGAIALQESRVREAEEGLALLRNLLDTNLGPPAEGQQHRLPAADAAPYLKVINKYRREQPGQLVRAIDAFIEALHAAGTVWTGGIEEDEEVEDPESDDEEVKDWREEDEGDGKEEFM